MSIRIDVDPIQRGPYLAHLLNLDGLGGVVEDKNAAYCAVSLTSTPLELKPIISARQEILMDILKKAGITAYNPETAPFSPDKGLSALPSDVYSTDVGRIAGARFFTAHNILPSTGYGIEVAEARKLNRIPVILMDSAIRVSRMQPPRTISLQYRDFDAQQSEFAEVFRLLKGYEPGIGFNEHKPALLGFDAYGNCVDLEQLVYQEFPELEYRFDPSMPIVQLTAKNIDVFRETQKELVVPL